MRIMKSLSFFTLVMLLLSLAGTVSASIGGIPGYSVDSSGVNSCHDCHTTDFGAPSNASSITGNTAVLVGSTNSYTVSLVAANNQNILYGGFDISSSAGTLISTNSETTINNGELVHSDRKATVDTGSSYDVSWTFDWQAPGTTGLVTLYACVLPVNGDGSATQVGEHGTRDALVACTTLSIDVQQEPVSIAGSNQTLTEGDLVTLDGTASSDSDGVINSYLWEQLSGAPASLSNANTDTATFTAPAVAANTTDELIFKLTVTDDDNLTSSSTVSIFVQDVLVSNTPPIADAGTDQSVNENTLVTLDASASSDNGSIASYAWLQTAGITTVTLSDSASVSPTFTSPLVDASNDVLSFQLTVTDDLGVQATDTVNISINDVDTPPTALISDSAGNPVTAVNHSTEYTLYGNFSSDPEGPISAYSWAQTAGTAIVVSGASNLSSFTFTPPDEVGTQIVIQLTVTGDEGAVQDSVSVSLTLENQPPIVDTGTDQLVTEGVSVTLDGSLSKDNEGLIASYLWEQLSGTTAVINNASSSLADFTAPDVPPDVTDELIFQLTVTDDHGLTDVGTVSVFVQDALVTNQLPVANAGGNQIVNENTTVTLDASASSDDGSIVTYLWEQTSGANTISFNDSSLVTPTFVAPSVTSTNDSIGIRLTVTDDLGTQSTDNIVITVNDVDTLPVAVISDAGGGAITSINNNRSVTLYGSFSTDAEGPITAYSWVQTAGKSIVNPGVANASSFTFNAPDDAGNMIDIQLTVTGDEGVKTVSTVSSFTLINQAPVADAGTAQLVVEGDLVALDGSASSDIDGTIASYVWTELSASGVTINNANSINPTFNAPDVAANATVNLSFRLTVTDSYGLNSTSDVVISVEDVLVSNITPTANAGVDQSVNENTSVTLDASASTDDGSIAAYLWTQTAGTAVALSDASVAAPDFTSPEVSSAGETLSFDVVVTDNLGISSVADRVNIIVNDVDKPPVAKITNVSGGVVSIIQTNQTVTLYGDFSTDADGAISAYRWSQVSGAGVISPGASNASDFTFTVPDVAGSSIDIQLTVTGDKGSVTNSVISTIVLANQAPVVDAGADQSVQEGDNIILTGSVSDTNNNLSRVQWRQINCDVKCVMLPVDVALPLASNQVQAQVVSPAIASGESLTMQFELVATDSEGLSTSSITNVNVTDNGINGFPEDSLTFLTNNNRQMAIVVEPVDSNTSVTVSQLQVFDDSQISDTENRPLSFEYDLSSLVFKLSSPGSVRVRLYFDRPIEEGLDFYQYQSDDGWVNTTKAKNFDDIKFTPSTGWAELAEEAEFNKDRTQVSFVLSDGGPSDDDTNASSISMISGIGQNPQAAPKQPGATGAMSPWYLVLTVLIFLMRFYLIRFKQV